MRFPIPLLFLLLLGLLGLGACGSSEGESDPGQSSFTEVRLVDALVTPKGMAVDAPPVELKSEAQAKKYFAGARAREELLQAYQSITEEGAGSVWVKLVAEGCFPPKEVRAAHGSGLPVVFVVTEDPRLNTAIACFRSIPTVALVGEFPAQ